MEMEILVVQEIKVLALMKCGLSFSGKKKIGKINSDLNAGNYTLTVGYSWNFPNFQTEKYFVIMSGVEKGLNPFFGYVLIVTCLIYLLAIVC
jgi:hypothetical protein